VASWTTATSALGRAPVLGQNSASATVLWAVSTQALGKRLPRGDATAAWSTSTLAAGTSPPVDQLHGSAVVEWSVTVEAVGHFEPRATATTSWTVVAVAPPGRPRDILVVAILPPPQWRAWLPAQRWEARL
jgi:hypothetical protein